MATTVYDAMGGADAVLALAEAWHRRCLDDPVVAHAFHAGTHPQHTERLATYWAEQLGGPASYTDRVGDHATLIAWFVWGTALLNHRYTAPEDVPDDLPLPRWDWDGTDGW